MGNNSYGRYCSEIACCYTKNEEEKQLKFALTPKNSSRNFSKHSSRQGRPSQLVNIHVPKTNITWVHKVYAPEEWTKLTTQKKWSVIKSKKHSWNEPLVIQPRSYYGPDLNSYIEQIVSIWNPLQYNLKTLSTADQFEIRDYFNTHVCPSAKLGDFLFEGVRSDVSETLFDAFGGDETDLEFFLLLEDF